MLVSNFGAVEHMQGLITLILCLNNERYGMFTEDVAVDICQVAER